MTDEKKQPPKRDLSKRYSWGPGKMIVTPPGEAPTLRDVLIYHDRRTDSIGIRLVGESPLRGYMFEVLRAHFRAVIDSGTESDRVGT